MVRQEIDWSRLKVTSRQQIAELRVARAHEREMREVRKRVRLYQNVRTASILILVTAWAVVAVLRGVGVLPPLVP
ncbi:hypothetical protein ACWDRB_18570 [Nonomuraea sp. NPDC003707]